MTYKTEEQVPEHWVLTRKQLQLNGPGTYMSSECYVKTGCLLDSRVQVPHSLPLQEHDSLLSPTELTETGSLTDYPHWVSWRLQNWLGRV